MKREHTGVVEVSLVATDDVSWVRHVDGRICGGVRIGSTKFVSVFTLMFAEVG